MACHLGLRDEIHGAAGHIGCLGILLRHPCRLAGMAHGPAGGEFIVRRQGAELAKSCQGLSLT